MRLPYVALKCAPPLSGLQPSMRRPTSALPNFILGTWTHGVPSEAAKGAEVPCPVGGAFCSWATPGRAARPIAPTVRPTEERRISLRESGILISFGAKALDPG